jgi:glycosyltransferase involved in cell wall biosynthesis
MSYNKDTVYQPNVADYDHFSKAAEDEYPVAEELGALQKPIALFSGNLAPHKVDFKLIDFLCGKRIDWDIVLVGPLWEGFSKRGLEWLRRMPNLKFTGHVQYEQLPGYLKAADVLIIPYLVNNVTSNVFPIKFFEYLATGKPVVATALPSLADYKDYVKLCDTYQGFAMGVREVLKSDTEERRKRRMELARQNTWEQRIEEMSEHIERKIK